MSMILDPPPCVLIAGARALYVGPGLGLSPHRIAVAVLAVALEADAPFELSFLDEGAYPAPEGPVGIALIPAGRLHHLRPRGPMAFLYLDALSDDVAVSARLAASGVPNPALAALLRDLWHRDGAAADGFDSLLATLGLRGPVVPDAADRDPVAAVIRDLDRNPHNFGPVAAAAARAGLSASRFQLRFRALTGVPYRRYRQWRRMAVVARALMVGESLTGAALDAGFASSAHLSAAFRAMFGIKPSLLLARGARIAVLDGADT